MAQITSTSKQQYTFSWCARWRRLSPIYERRHSDIMVCKNTHKNDKNTFFLFRNICKWRADQVHYHPFTSNAPNVSYLHDTFLFDMRQHDALRNTNASFGTYDEQTYELSLAASYRVLQSLGKHGPQYHWNCLRIH